jgi:hypothetical protein
MKRTELNFCFKTYFIVCRTIIMDEALLFGLRAVTPVTAALCHYEQCSLPLQLVQL